MDYPQAITYLSLEEGASPGSIRAAYSDLAKESHPDTGGSDLAMATLNEARDVALAGPQAPGDTLVPVSLVRELVKTQTAAVDRMQEQAERREDTNKATRAVVRYEVDRLQSRRRAAAFAASVGGGLAVFVGFLRAVVLSGITEAQSESFAAFIGGFAVVAAGFAVAAWFLGVRAKNFENLVEDASDALSERDAYLSVITEIEDLSGKGSPWKRPALHEAIAEWIDKIGFDAEGSVAELARRVGPKHFAKLLLAKGLELGVLEEKILTVEGRPQVQYSLAWSSEP